MIALLTTQYYFFVAVQCFLNKFRERPFLVFFYKELYFQFSDNFLIIFQFSKFSDKAKKFSSKYFLWLHSHFFLSNSNSSPLSPLSIQFLIMHPPMKYQKFEYPCRHLFVGNYTQPLGHLRHEMICLLQGPS